MRRSSICAARFLSAGEILSTPAKAASRKQVKGESKSKPGYAASGSALLARKVFNFEQTDALRLLKFYDHTCDLRKGDFNPDRASGYSKIVVSCVFHTSA
jgi:hypothetical protein